MTNSPHHNTDPLQALHTLSEAWLRLARHTETGLRDAAAAAAHDLDELRHMAGISRDLARQANEMARRCHALAEDAAHLEEAPLERATSMNREQPRCQPSCAV